MRTLGRIGLIGSFFVGVCMILALVLAEICEKDLNKHIWQSPLHLIAWIESALLLAILAVYTMKRTECLENEKLPLIFKAITAVCTILSFSIVGYLVLWPILQTLPFIAGAALLVLAILVVFRDTVKAQVK